MKYLTLNKIKSQCVIDDWYHDDDNYLIDLGDAAEGILQANLDCNLDDIVRDNGGVMPAALMQALLLMVGHFYRNREAVVFGSANALPFGYDFLISQYKNYTTSKL